MRTPNPMFPEGLSNPSSSISPSSPTAWYMGVTPSLDGINLDKPVPARPPGIHHRSRSDFAGNYPKIPVATSLGKTISIMSPTEEVPTPFISPLPVQRNSQSRIPVSTQRTGVSSESGDSSPPRTISATSQHTGHWKPATKNFNNLHISKPDLISSSPDRRSNPSPSPRTPRGHNLVSMDQQARRSPRLAAYISEAQPLKSPPLRSSRPRQPVSTASTSASRARAAERLANNNSQITSATRKRQSRILPELGGVDFAARRQLIEEAVTKTVKEGEEKKAIEAERKRRSISQESRLQSAARDSVYFTPVESYSNTIPERSEDVTRGTDGKQPGVQTVESRPERDLSISTAHLVNRSVLDMSQEDSPTLGIANRFSSGRFTPNESPTPPSEPEPLSAMTTDTADTFFDNDPQDGPADVSDDHRTVLSNIMNLRRPSPDDRDSNGPPSAQLFQGMEGSFSDRDDEGSIQIMLRGTPVTDSVGARHIFHADETGEDYTQRTENRWSADSWSPSERYQEADTLHRGQDSPPEQAGERHAQQLEDHTYRSTAGPVGNNDHTPWSPDSAVSILSARTILDSESYNPISRLLESYHNPASNPMSPDDMRDLGERILRHSPNLARAGGWDPQKVTQLYLQSLGRSPYAQSTALPEPLRLISRQPAEQSVSIDQVASKHLQEEKLEETETNTQQHIAEGDSAEDPEEQNVVGRESLEVKDMLNPQRASLNQPDDWANTSPSMLDWIHHQAEDTPTEDKPLPVPKNWIGGVLDVPAKKDVQRARTPGFSADGHPQLPEIRRTESGLGIDINIESPHDGNSPVVRADQASSNDSPISSRITRITNTASPSPIRKQPPPVPIGYERNPVPSTSTANTISGTNGRFGTNETSHQVTSAPKSIGGTESTSTTIGVQPNDKPLASSDPVTRSASPLPEQKRLTRRRHILKELVDTEYSFGQDMTVVNDIYKETSAVLNSAEDVKVLFGNSDQIAAFSTTFLDALKQAAKSVYVQSKARRWARKRDSETTSASRDTDDQSSVVDSDLNDEEKDRKTFIGEVFNTHMSQMEKVYGDYLKNHDAANQKLQSIMTRSEGKVWLQECRTWAHDLTTAWDLDSLLVKPVQRILKYPLLLKELLEVTPENHPDFSLLDCVAREMVGVSKRINDLKKRADLVGQVVGANKKRKEFEGRIGLKGFSRRTEKFKQQVGLSDTVQDAAYNKVSEQFGVHYFQVQVVLRDIEMYTTDVQTFVNRFNDFVLAIEAHIDVGHSSYPEVESKWRTFRLSMRDILTTALADHVSYESLVERGWPLLMCPRLPPYARML